MIEKRKIMVLGKSSRVVALPKKWVDEHKLQKGDEIIFVVQEDGSLLMYPRTPVVKKPRVLEIEIKLNSERGLLERQLIASYLNDYSIIKLKAEKFFTNRQQQELRLGLRKLAGLQVVEASSSEIIIQNLLKLSDLDLQKSIHRAHLIASSMCKDAIKALEYKDSELARTVINLDEDVNQFYFLIAKQLRCALVDKSLVKALGITPIECVDYLLVMQRIEHVADHAKMIAQKVMEIGGEGVPFELVKLILSFAHLAYKVYQNAVTAFLMEDTKLANHAINLRDELKTLKDKAKRMFEEQIIPSKVRVILYLNEILNSLERIADYGTDIAEVAIDKALE